MSTSAAPESKPSLRPLILVLLGLVAVVVVLRLVWQDAQPPEGRRVGNVCPEVAWYDADDQPVKLSDHKGKVVLIQFWGTWCAPCRQQLPHERDMVTGKYKDRPFVLLGVAQDAPQTLKAFMEKNPLPWPNIADDSGILLKAWNVKVVPSAVLVDHAGIIRHAWMEGVSSNALWVAVDELVVAAEQQ